MVSRSKLEKESSIAISNQPISSSKMVYPKLQTTASPRWLMHPKIKYTTMLAHHSICALKPSITIIIQKKQTSGVSASSTTNYYTVITYQYPPIYRLSSLVSSHRTRALRSNAQYSTVISFSYTSIRRIKRFYTEIPLARGRKTNFFKRN